MNGMLAVVAGILFVAFLLSYFPSIEAPFLTIGEEIETATGQTVDHSAANAAQSALYGILAVVAFFGAMTDAGLQPRGRA